MDDSFLQDTTRQSYYADYGIPLKNVFITTHGNGDLINFAICGIYQRRIIMTVVVNSGFGTKYDLCPQRSKRVLRLE